MDTITSPIPSKSRQSLRERCGTSLTIIPTSYRMWNRMYACNCNLEFFLLPARKELFVEAEELPVSGDDYEVDEDDEELEEEEEEANDYEVDEEDESEDEEEEEEEEEETDDYEDDEDMESEEEVSDGYEADEDEDEPEDEEGEDYDQVHQISPPSPTPPLEESNHLLEIKEGLYIALEANIESLQTFDLTVFTHILRISYASPTRNEPLRLTTQLRYLDITCPAASFYLPPNQTAVDSVQLGAARDFLALALPHGSETWWPEEQRRIGKVGDWREGLLPQDEQEIEADGQFVVLAPGGPDEFQTEQDEPDLEDDMKINALILGPACRPVDVVSILYCYLAFLEGMTVENLSLEGYCDKLWADVMLGPGTMDQVNMIARAI